MVTLDLPNWEAFQKVVASKRDGAQTQGWQELLFRGQPCASLKLQTTLERYSSKQFTYEDYYCLVLRMKPKVESSTKKRWELPTVCPKPSSDEYMDYLVYLRHHGFPSPLLDWSLSEDIAAFFAYRKPLTVNCNVAIFLYVEFPARPTKIIHPDEPTIITLECNPPSVPRHVKQKTKYTVCMRESKGQFSSHEDVFLKNQTRQDLLMKYVIPGSERDNVFKKLSSKGITAHSLFESDDSLMETLAFEEIDP